MRSRGYALPPTAPTDTWSALRHGGHSVCVVVSAMCVNLPVETFSEGDTTLSSALSTLEPLDRTDFVCPPTSLVAIRQLAAMLLRCPATCMATAGKRKREEHDFRRNDVARSTFTVRKRDCDPVTLERCVFLIEEVRADPESEIVVGVRLWKLVLDHWWRESRSFGLQMYDRRDGAPSTPTELLQKYIKAGSDERYPLIDNFKQWLKRQPDWATRSLLSSETQKKFIDGKMQLVPGDLHALGPESVFDASRPEALLAGLHRNRSPTQSQGESATYITVEESAESGRLLRLRFPPNTRIYGIHPLSNPSTTALPSALRARLEHSRLSSQGGN
jgi:hypothetical protein